MRAVLNFLLSRWVLSFVGVAILALLVWFFGPLVELLEGWLARLVVIVVLVLLWAVSNLSIDLYRRRREKKLENSVAEQVQVAVDDGTGSVVAGFVRLGAAVAPVVCETLDGAAAASASRALAPVSDAGVRVEDDSDLPRSLALLSLIGPELAAEPGAVLERWQESESIVRRGPGTPLRRRNLTLRAVVGQAAGDPLTLDLRAQGPHALVGGERRRLLEHLGGRVDPRHDAGRDGPREVDGDRAGPAAHVEDAQAAREVR